MNQSVGIVAVEHIGMAAGSACKSGGEDGTVLAYLPADDVVPLTLGVILPVVEANRGVIVEVGGEGIGQQFDVAAALLAILHVDGIAAVFHELRHRHALLFSAYGRVFGCHVLPLVSALGKIGRERHIVHRGAHIAVFPLSLCRPLMVAHHLRHGRSHTTGGGMGGAHIERGEQVVGIGLVPGDIAQQRGHRLHRRLLCGCHAPGAGLLCGERQLPSIQVEPLFERCRHTVGIECPLIGIAQQHLLGAICADNGKTAAAQPVGHIQQGLSALL